MFIIWVIGWLCKWLNDVFIGFESIILLYDFIIMGFFVVCGIDLLLVYNFKWWNLVVLVIVRFIDELGYNWY